MKSDRPVRKPACIIAGGETTVTVNANAATGNGGRQQELALSAATHIMGMRRRKQPNWQHCCLAGWWH